MQAFIVVVDTVFMIAATALMILPSGAMVPGSGRTQVPVSLRLPHAAVGENR